MRAFRQFPRIIAYGFALAGIAGCAYIIPEDPNMPRNNTVLGGPRKPVLNNSMAPQSSQQYDRNNTAPATARSFDVPPVVTPESAEQAASMAPAAGSDGYRMPSENKPYQVAAAGYPVLNSVPPRPVMQGEGSAEARLKQAQHALEVDRAAAVENKAALDRAAAAEPSLISEMPPTNQSPMMAPVQPALQAPAAQPVPQPQSYNALTSDNALAAATLAPAAGGPVSQPVGISLAKVTSTTPSLPNSPVFAPPVPMYQSANAAPLQPAQFKPQPQLAPIAAVAPQPVTQPLQQFVPSAQQHALTTQLEQPVQAPLLPVQKVVSFAPAAQQTNEAPNATPEVAQAQPLSGQVAAIASVAQPNPETFSPLVTKKAPIRLDTTARDFNPLAPFAKNRNRERVATAPTIQNVVTALPSAPQQPQVMAAVAPVSSRVSVVNTAVQPTPTNAPNVTMGDFNPLTPVAAGATAAPVPAPPAQPQAPVTAAAAATYAPAAGSAPSIRRGDFDPLAVGNSTSAAARPAYIAPSRYEQRY